MKKTIKFLFFSLAVVILSSCEDVVQIKLDQGSKLYVVDAFVNNLRTPQTVRVMTNDNYFSNRDAPPVTNATVVLKDLTGNTFYNFIYTERGYYVFNPSSTDTISRVDHQYELNVTIDGVTYTSLTIQKRPAKIDSIESVYNDGTSGFGTPKPSYFCGLYAKDKVDNNTDYYWVKTFRNDTLFSGSDDINLSIDGTNGPVSDIGVDSTNFTPPITFIGFKEYQKGNTCKVEIHSISRATYFFLLQALTQINNGGLFATTPENVKSNIVTPKDAKTKAIGWFNMATVVSMTKVVH